MRVASLGSLENLAAFDCQRCRSPVWYAERDSATGDDDADEEEPLTARQQSAVRCAAALAPFAMSLQ